MDDGDLLVIVFAVAVGFVGIVARGHRLTRSPRKLGSWGKLPSAEGSGHDLADVFIGHRTARAAHDEAVAQLSKRPFAVQGSLTRLRDLGLDDPAFSVAGFRQVMAALHTRSWLAAALGMWEGLEAHVAPPARTDLTDAVAGRTLGAVALTRLEVTEVRRPEAFSEVDLELRAVQRVLGGEAPRLEAVREVWTVKRTAGARSADPDEEAELGCPSCREPVSLDADGRCTSCNTPIAWAQRSWQIAHVHVTSLGELPPLRPPDEAIDQASWGATSPRDVSFHAQLTAFRERHPDFDPERLAQAALARVHRIDQALNAGDLRSVDELLTPLFRDRLEVWIERLERDGLALHRGMARLDRAQLDDVVTDTWRETAKVRLWLTRSEVWRRATQDGSEGPLVAGSIDTPRKLSQVWVLTRSSSSHREEAAAQGLETGWRVDDVIQLQHPRPDEVV